MKHLYFLLFLFMSLVLFNGCIKDDDEEITEVQMEDIFSTIDEFRAALFQLDSIANEHALIAYLDTLSDGMPDTNGNKMPLTEFINYIIYKVELNQVDSAIDLLYKFNGMPFSLISYLIKARLANHINNHLLINALALIPLPPIIVPNFQPPQKPVIVQQKCQCTPNVRIKVVWAYKKNCGNREGYPVGNVLNNLPLGKYFKVIGEVRDCNCKGTWTKDIQVIGTSSYSTGGKEPNMADIWVYSPGTVKVTFTFTCTDCGSTDSETMTLNFI